MSCPVCSSAAAEIYLKKRKCGREYYICRSCFHVYLDAKYFLKRDEEFQHYQRHNNDVEDKAYQDFVLPLIKFIEVYTNKEVFGLDYGCGPGPVIAYLLKKRGYSIDLYDPFFLEDKKLELDSYDFLILSEVAEHFQNPVKEFQNLYELLNPGGYLFIMTALLDSVKDFASWHYHRDPSHVNFYSIKSLSKIASRAGFELMDTDHKKCTVLRRPHTT